MTGSHPCPRSPSLNLRASEERSAQPFPELARIRGAVRSEALWDGAVAQQQVIGAVRSEALWDGAVAQQQGSPDQILGVAGSDRPGERPTARIAQRLDLGGPSAARAADGWADGPPCAPAAERWTLTGGGARAPKARTPLDPVKAWNPRAHTPWRLKRLKRLSIVVSGPSAEGQSRQRAPARSRWMMPPITRRSSTRGPPRRPRASTG